MKKIQFLSLMVLFVGSVVVISCGSGRGYYSQPGYRSYLSLIISPGPGFVMNRYRDGRFYYRSPQGYLYWKGYDNRFYLDRSYLGRAHYYQSEYNEWQRHGRKYYKRRHY